LKLYKSLAQQMPAHLDQSQTMMVMVATFAQADRMPSATKLLEWWVYAVYRMLE